MATGSMADGACRRVVCETADHSGREVRQPGSCIGQEVAGDGVGLIGGAEDDGKQAREIGWRSRVGLLHKFVEGREFPGVEDHGGERGVEALIAGVQNRGNGAAADPVAGAFVGDCEPPASGTRGVTSSVAAVGNGTGAGDRDHVRALGRKRLRGRSRCHRQLRCWCEQPRALFRELARRGCCESWPRSRAWQRRPRRYRRRGLDREKSSRWRRPDEWRCATHPLPAFRRGERCCCRPSLPWRARSFRRQGGSGFWCRRRRFRDSRASR